MANPFEKGR